MGFVIATESRNDDYLDIVLTQSKEKVFRFKKMPVLVFIESCTPLEVTACKQAFAMWEGGTNELIKFKRVDGAKRARIRIKFLNLPQSTKAESGSDLDGGHTLMEWHSRIKLISVFNHSNVFVPPQVVEINLSSLDARPTSERAIALRNIIAHELGHAIGLLAHSPDPRDLMYSKTDENSGISSRDLNTVRRLYELKPDVCL